MEDTKKQIDKLISHIIPSKSTTISPVWLSSEQNDYHVHRLGSVGSHHCRGGLKENGPHKEWNN